MGPESNKKPQISSTIVKNTKQGPGCGSRRRVVSHRRQRDGRQVVQGGVGDGGPGAGAAERHGTVVDRPDFHLRDAREEEQQRAQVHLLERARGSAWLIRAAKKLF